MLVLALDTTTRGGSCALARDGVVCREQASDASKPQAARLPGELIALLDGEQAQLRDVDVFAVATGPGSFTGLRIGIATMQGLAFAAGKPLIGISALDALAAVAQSPSVVTWVDAWRGEVYAARYEDGREVESPSVESPLDILGRLRASAQRDGAAADPPTDTATEEPDGKSAQMLFIGDGVGTHADAINGALNGSARIADPVMPLLAGVIARLATDAARAGHRPPAHAIRPLYVRRPDAELARDARAGR